MDDKWWQWRTRSKSATLAVEVPAQVVYKEMVKDTLSPGLREHGFKGSGGRYACSSPTCWALLGLQRSAYSDGVEVQFTVNLLVANRLSWDEARVDRPHLPQRPSAGTSYGEPAVRERIGMIHPDRADKWWRIYPGVDVAAVATDVLHDVEAFAIPWLRQQVESRGGAG